MVGPSEVVSDALRRLDSGESIRAVKRGAEELMAQLSADEPSMAEQRLADDGLPEKRRRAPCSIHVEMHGDELERFRASLPEGHVLRMMVDEHEHLLDFLDELDHLNAHLQDSDSVSGTELTALRTLGERLVGAANHSKREEDVVFAGLERLGVTGPPYALRRQHSEMRPMELRLVELAADAYRGRISARELRESLARVVPRLSRELREHISSENTILYPMAQQSIKGPTLWDDMKRRADAIGYCSFTPRH